MLKKMNKYVCSFQICIRNSLEYRFDFVTSFLFKFLPVFVYFFLWKMIYISSGSYIEEMKGMTLNHVVSYIIIIQFIDILISSNGIESKIMSEIKEGELSKYLLKPVNYFVYNLSISIANKILYVAPVVVAFLLIELIFKKYIVLFQNITYILFFIPALLIAFFIRYFIAVILGLIGFLLTEVSSLYIMTNRIILFLSGMLFPLIFLPAIILNIFSCLPFYYIAYFPAMIAIGNITYRQIILGLVLGGVWLFLLYGITVALWRSGLKKYESVGG